ERAVRLKAKIQQLGKLGKGAFRHVRRIEDFRFLSFQRGPRDGLARLFLVTPNQVQEIAGVIAPPEDWPELLEHAQQMAQVVSQESITADGVERLGVVSQHLFSAKQTQGVFIHLDLVDAKSMAKAYRDLHKQKVPEESEGEGVVKELQAM